MYKAKKKKGGRSDVEEKKKSDGDAPIADVRDGIERVGYFTHRR